VIRTLRTLAPAKLNTFLAVGPPDRIGYHPLRTIFRAISLGDEVTVTTGGSGKITVDGMDLPAENTLTKAMRFVREIASLPAHDVHVVKRIPAQAGLGGGSSDAAAYLRIANYLSGGQIPVHELSAIAQSIGADVPFFLVGGAARGEGYGEELTPIDHEPVRHLVVVMPSGVTCSTPEMYKTLDAAPREFAAFPADLWTLYNDFERVAPCECLDGIERLKVFGASAAGLTGSGAAYFGVVRDADEAARVAARVREEGLGAAWAVTTIGPAEATSIATR
jgi:4-diphosphocytidyl-2-C-methyl-D-erythritol kinase